MKTFIVATLIVLSTVALNSTHAQGKDGFGVGVIVGEPTGLSFKKWTGSRQAIAAGIAWSFSENASFHFHADYLQHKFDVVKMAEGQGQLPVYFGLGGRLKLREGNSGRGRNDDDPMVGVRVPLGVSYLFADAPVDLFAEIVPVLDLVPDTDFDLSAAIGARFYF
jgi:hypothetical protein